jgi:hypothetical protein
VPEPAPTEEDTISMTAHRRPLALLAAAALALGGLAACGDDDVETSTGADDAVTEPDQPTSDPDDPGSDFGEDFSDEDAEAARERARELLGTPEADLPDDVRIRRRGEEQFMLTEDYVLGRITVELDDDGSGTFVVTSVVVELPDGPETFAADGP